VPPSKNSPAGPDPDDLGLRARAKIYLIVTKTDNWVNINGGYEYAISETIF
jgi:hypothetical protein